MYLAVETSGPVICVAIEINGKVISRSHARLDNGSNNSEALPGIVSELLSSEKKGYSEIEGIIVGSGPGSFTGLRIGFGYAKGLAIAIQKPMVTVQSLDAFAFEGLRDGTDVVAIANAQRNEFFCRAYSITNNIKTETVIIKADNLPNFAAQAGLENCIWLGYPESNIPGIETREPQIVGSSLISLGKAELKEMSFSIKEIADLSPFYLRSVNARTIADRQSKGL